MIHLNVLYYYTVRRIVHKQIFSVEIIYLKYHLDKNVITFYFSIEALIIPNLSLWNEAFKKELKSY